MQTENGRRHTVIQHQRSGYDYLLFLFIFFSICLSSDKTFAVEVEEPASAIQAPIPNAFGVSGNLQIAPGSGSLSDSIALSVPRARRGFEPRLSLSYSSSAGAGDLGRGWSLGGLGYVENYTQDGVYLERYYEVAGTLGANAPLSYAYALNGQAGEIVPVAGDDQVETRFRAAFENSYVEFERFWPDRSLPEDHFEARTGDGVVNYFGRTASSRTPSKWFLDEQRDSSGNTIQYRYVSLDRNGDACNSTPDNCALYPAEILYASHPLLASASNRIVFDYEDRPDARVSWRQGYREVRGQRLARISMYASDCGDVTSCPILVRRYELSYSQSPLNGESQLETIVLVGADDSSRTTIRTLEYGTRQLGWSRDGANVVSDIPDALNFVDSQERSRGTTIIDVNGDGYNDALARVDDGSRPSVFLGGPNGFTRDDGWSLSFATIGVDLAVKAGDRYGASTGVYLVDVNGDTRIDVVVNDGSRSEVWVNTGRAAAASATQCNPCGWVLDEDLTSSLESIEVRQVPLNSVDPVLIVTGLDVTDPTVDTGVRFVDFNGDGLSDIIQSYRGRDAARGDFEVSAAFVNTGTSIGWQDVTNQVAGIPKFFQTNVFDQGYQFLELNGDGLIDYVRLNNREFFTPQAYLGTPAGWVFDQEFSNSLIANPDIESRKDRKGTGLLPVDYNADGLVDFIKANSIADAQGFFTNTVLAFKNNGTGWERDADMEQTIPDIRLGSAFAFNVDLAAVGGEEGGTNGLQVVDVTGDSIPDLLFAREAGTSLSAWKLPIGADSKAESGLLIRSTNAFGEVSDIDWEFSSRFDNRLRQWDSPTYPLVTPVRQDMSVVLPVPVQVSKSDGRGNVFATTVDYIGGGFSEDGFQGFARSSQVLPSGLRKEILHYRVTGFYGRILTEEHYDAGGQLRARMTNDWRRATAVVSPPGSADVDQPKLNSTLNETFDADGNRVQFTGSRYVYDDRLNVTRIDRTPNVFNAPVGDTRIEFTWIRDDAAGLWSVNDSTRMVRIIDDALLSETIFTYDGLSRGQVTRGLPTERSDWVEGSTYVTQQLLYDGFGNLTGLVDRNDSTYAFEYGDPARVFRTRAVDPMGRVTTSEYDSRFGSLVLDTNAGGIERRSEYDSFGRLAAVYLPGDDSSEPSIRYSYSPVGVPDQSYLSEQLIERGNPQRFSTTNYFDARGLVYQQDSDTINGQMVRETREFDHSGAIVAESRPFFVYGTPVFRTTERDEFGKPLRIVDADGEAVTLDYVADQVVVTDRRNEQRFLTVNAAGDIVAVRQTNSSTGVDELTQYRFDERRQMVEVEDALGSVTTISYDGLGRRTRLVDASLGEFVYEYDSQGNVSALIAPDGGLTAYTYNGAGELISKTFPDGSSQSFEYGTSSGAGNGVGKLVGIEDDAGTLSIIYDDRGNIVERRRTIFSTQGADATYVTGYAFDNLDRLQRLTYPDGYSVDYEYEAAGSSLTTVTDSDGRTLAQDIVRNASGQIESMRFGNGTSSQSDYDILGRPSYIGAVASDGSLLQGLDYRYDNGHNIIAIDDSVAGQMQSFDYDGVGRLIRADGNYGIELYDYDAAGGLLRKGALAFATDPLKPQQVNCAMDAAIDPTAATCSTSAANGTANAFAIDYDGRGNVAVKGDQRYEYNAENRLVRVGLDNGSELQRNVYDAFGQRLIEINDGVETISIDGIYQEFGDKSVRHVMVDGLLVSTVVKPKSEVRLIASVAAGNSVFPQSAGITGAAAFLLLSVGWKRSRRRRFIRFVAGIKRHVSRKPGQRGTALALLPIYLLALFQAGCSGGGAPGGGVSVGGGSGGGGAGGGGGTAVEVAVQYYHADHLGSIQVISDADGLESERREYRPYGEQNGWTDSGPVGTEESASFTGQNYDQATSLYYMNARHYDAQLGRFLSADTIVAEPGDPRTLHRYGYAGGNPIRLSDPSGRWFYDEILDGLSYVWDGIESAANEVAAAANSVADFFEENGNEFATGLVYGAIIGASLVLIAASFGVLGPVGPIVAGMMLGAALGALATTIPHMASGGSIESLAGPLLLSVVTGAVTGAIGGATLGRLGQGLSKIGTDALKRTAISTLTRVASRGAQSIGFLLTKGRSLARIGYLGQTTASGRARNLSGTNPVGDLYLNTTKRLPYNFPAPVVLTLYPLTQ